MDMKSGGAEQNFETYFVKLFSKIENKWLWDYKTTKFSRLEDRDQKISRCTWTPCTP